VSNCHTGEYLERIDLQGINFGTIDLNDRQLVTINREVVPRIAGNRDESQSIAVMAPRVNLKPSLDPKGQV
jgi:hypothetical protein